MMGGITGNDDTGAYSVIVGKGGNEDLGDTIWYLPPGSDKKSKVYATMDSPGALTLARSILTELPVRVIRAANGNSVEYRPKAGFRYDGLYEVKSVEENLTDAGGSYVRFELTRLPNQTPINKDRPNDKEIEMFKIVKDGF